MFKQGAAESGLILENVRSVSRSESALLTDSKSLSNTGKIPDLRVVSFAC